jgi:hypothetical protein
MPIEPAPSHIARLVAQLPPKAKQPASATILNNWIAQAEGKVGPEGRGGRLGWLVALAAPRLAVRTV